ncbi:cation efflux protein [Penicillium cataractarum]|uniref:Cation efflux protein n=1 Tax=Penicillium cataractarum TaxID=2100454 RepID=A0A9W9RZB5_9EURO|nr:cation efflux protein [Penicillium cataractarum]KAJ5368475.1 cation efflux protein [Penicillium cataractarum]
MMLKISRIQRLSVVIGISFCFFLAEISIGFYTHSLALVADAFHYLNDLVGFIIALVAAIVAERTEAPKALTFGWQRIQLLGAFFNGVLLFGLGISVFLQSIERFISLQKVENPKFVLIMGCIGFGLNLISILFLHDHGHDHGDGHSHGHSHGNDHSHSHGTDSGEGSAPEASTDTDPDAVGLMDGKHIHHKHHVNKQNTSLKPHRDLAMMGVLLHVIGDCANNLGVIIAAAVIWFANYGGRFYADPAVSMGIAIMIFLSSIPLIKHSGLILLQSAPRGVDHDDVKHDLEQVPGVLAVHELHIWRLNQTKSLASAHVVLDGDIILDFDSLAKTIRECFHAYGIHSVTLQPEIHTSRQVSTAGQSTHSSGVDTGIGEGESSAKRRQSLERAINQCKTGCGSLCLDLTCCR